MARGRLQPQTARTRKNIMIVVMIMVSVTAMPYAAARRLEDWKYPTRASVPSISIQFTVGT